MHNDSRRVEEVQALLSIVRYPDAYDDMMLYPGPQRQRLVEWITSRLLCGRSMDDALLSRAIVDPPAGGLSHEERCAKRCHALLAVLGIETSANAIRGSGPEAARLSLLVDLLRLLAAAGPSLAPPPSTAGSASACVPGVLPPKVQQQLLDAAACLADRLWSDRHQLFPPDLAAEFARYRGAAHGLAAQQAHLQEQLSSLTQRLSELRVHHAPPPAVESGAPACGQAGALQTALRAFLDDAAELARVYEQELSAWTPAAPPVPSGQQLGDCSMGPDLHALLAGYQDLTALLRAAKQLEGAHEAVVDMDTHQQQRLTGAASVAAHRAAELGRDAAVLEVAALAGAAPT